MVRKASNYQLGDLQIHRYCLANRQQKQLEEVTVLANFNPLNCRTKSSDHIVYSNFTGNDRSIGKNYFEIGLI